MHRPIVIQGAMDAELSLLLHRLQSPRRILKGGYAFYTGYLQDVPVVLSRTLIGAVNVAAATTLALSFSPIALLNQGTAGGHSEKAPRGSIVLGTSYLNASSVNTAFRAAGQGVDLTGWTLRPCEQAQNGRTVEKTVFTPDSRLLSVARRVKERYHDGPVVEGVISSSDFWNRELDRIAWARETHHSLCEEMEAAPVCQLCESYGIPMLGWRVISNNEVTGEDYNLHTARLSQLFALYFLDGLHETPLA